VEPLYRRALEVWKASGDGLERDLAFTMNNLATLYRTLGRYAEAEPLYAAALPLLKSDAGSLWTNLAELYRAEGKYEKAESAARTSLDFAERAHACLHVSGLEAL
jgi:tetratricopeptide (TPR) repeat protein